MLIITPGPESALLEGGGEGVDANQVGQKEGPSGLGLPRPQTCLPPYQGLGRVSPDSDRTVHSCTWTAGSSVPWGPWRPFSCSAPCSCRRLRPSRVGLRPLGQGREDGSWGWA